MRLLAQSLGVLAILFIVSGSLIQWVERDFRSDTFPAGGHCDSHGALPGGFEKRGIAMEFACTACDAEVILGNEQHANRKIMRSALDYDTYFIIAYWLLFMAMGFLLTQRGSSVAAWVGATAMLTGTAAAIFDFIENARIRQVSNTRLVETTDAMVCAVREATRWKWGLCFATVALLATTFFLIKGAGAGVERWIARLTGLSFAAAALTGFVGLRYNRLIPLTIMLQLPGLIGLMILSFRWPEAFLEKS